MRNIFLIAGSAFLLSCANSANHEVVDMVTEYDNNLTCEQIAEEIVKLNAIKEGVLKDKSDMTGADLVDGVLWFPFNVIVKQSNYSSATDAANERLRLLQGKRTEKQCLPQEMSVQRDTSVSTAKPAETIESVPKQGQSEDVVQRMRALNKLYIDGVIDEKSYNEKKKALLKEL